MTAGKEGGVEIDITALGSGGDGIGQAGERTVYVPGTVPGDRVSIHLDGRKVSVQERLADSPDRVQPPCPHFGRCGGCALQHVGDGLYRRWKQDLLARALSHRGLDCELSPLVAIPPGTRRRARFIALVAGGRPLLGYRAKASHRVTDVHECPLLIPAIPALLPALRALLGGWLKPRESAEISVTAVGAAADISVDTKRGPDLAFRQTLAAFADSEDLARLTWGGELLAQRGPVTLDAGGLRIPLPPGGFLQPTAMGESFLQDEVARILAGVTSLADLYAGCGALSAGMAASGARLHAFEQDAAQCQALTEAARRGGIGERVEATPRDLTRQPVAGKELNRFDGVVLDPPRAGAAAQAAVLAESSVPRIAYVSCNPASFARDARALVDGGYRLVSAVPLDQFPWSPHLELVAEFSR